MLGGLAGGLIWILVGYFTGAEIGWIAWGVGFLVGVGVRFAAHLGEQDETPGQGLLAGALAIAGMKKYAAKYDLHDEHMIAIVSGSTLSGGTSKSPKLNR